MRVFVLGRPGVGKTTILGVLWRNFGIRHFVWDDYWRKKIATKKGVRPLEWLQSQRFASVHAYTMFHRYMGVTYFEEFLEVVDKCQSELVFIEANFWAMDHVLSKVKENSVILEREERELAKHLRRQGALGSSSAKAINKFYRDVWAVAPRWSDDCGKLRLQTSSSGIRELMSYASKISHSW